MICSAEKEKEEREREIKLADLKECFLFCDFFRLVKTGESKTNLAYGHERFAGYYTFIKSTKRKVLSLIYI